MVIMKKFAYMLALLPFAAGCNTDDVMDVTFDVTMKNDPQEIYAGDEVTFDFTGDPDYIVFWSGEDGSKYANRDRTSLGTIESMKLSYTMQQRYCQKETKDMLHVMISTDFDGDYTAAGIEAAKWTELSNQGGDDWKVPTEVNNNLIIESGGDLTEYADGTFTLAFRYYTPNAPLSDFIRHPREDITISLEKVSGGQVITASNPQDNFGFQFVPIDYPAEKYSVDATTILIQPNNDLGSLGAAYNQKGFKNVEIWCISNVLNPLTVAPDTGDPIRSLTTPIESYTYIFEEPGTYTVSFVARNTNAWNMKEVVREIVVEVQER